MTAEEALEVTAIHSVAGLLAASDGGACVRPFRAPHHTVSEMALVGGGDPPRPGEVSLAHQGVLFLDELAEFRRAAIESLRQPLEDGTASVARVRARATFPARPLLVAATNPCRCGYRGDGTSRCICTNESVRAYRARMSGPLIDRIDVHVILPPVEVAALQHAAPGESTAEVRARVEVARAVQAERRRAGEVRASSNAALSPREVERIAALCDRGAHILGTAMSRLSLSARAYGRVLRVARTIADLDGSASVRPAHIAEAIALRVLDRETSAAAA
jgi:magnesium chelatase family protein